MNMTMQPARGTAENVYHAIIEALPHVIWVADAEGNVTYLNHAWTEWTGRDVEDSLGTRWTESLHPDDAPGQLAKWKRAYSEGAPYEGECRFLARDGSYVHISFIGVPVKDEAGDITSWFGIDLNVTDLKRTEEQLRDKLGQLKASEEKLAALNRSLEARVRERTERLRSMTVARTTAEEHERHRIAAELHDGVLQLLATASISLGTHRRSLTSTSQRSKVDEIQGVVSQSIVDCRSLLSELSAPPQLYEIGLGPAVRWLATSLSARHEIRCDVEDDGQAKPLGRDLLTTLYQTIRELLWNGVRHGRAQQLRVFLSREDDLVTVHVEDDGVGFDASRDPQPTAVGGFGLFGIRERLEPLEGHLEIHSTLGHGTRITVTVPIETSGSETHRETGSVLREAVGDD